MNQPASHRTKYIFVTGGVVSSLGKGIVSASVGALLESRGLRVRLSKADPYINVDPGTMSPIQHGEVFVTEDGAETDLDIGHYERFTRAELSKGNSFSTGQVYDAVLAKERRGDYLGGTVQVVPHVTGQIKENIYRASSNCDVSIVEIGGTVGDIESLPYLETIRQIRYELGQDNVICIHLTLVPYIAAARELKTKPTQHSVKELRSIGIAPDILVCRADRSIPQELKDKIAIFCNVLPKNVMEAIDVESIYFMPLILHRQGLDQRIVEHLNIWTRQPDLSEWETIHERLESKVGKKKVRIGVVGKYTNVVDSYKSIGEALIHGSIQEGVLVETEYVDAATLDDSNKTAILGRFDGIIVPGGFGTRGVEGKMSAITYARTQGVPFLGICLGLQLAVIEFARSVVGIPGANSEEFDEETKEPLICLMEDQKDRKEKGGSMRLGGYPCAIQSETKLAQVYGTDLISERHRHRYEFNNAYREACEEKGLVFSGLSPDGLLVEVVELANHPFFMACQFHPELKSKPMVPHPLFSALIRGAIGFQEKGL
jgi:CTP synthase